MSLDVTAVLVLAVLLVGVPGCSRSAGSPGPVTSTPAEPSTTPAPMEPMSAETAFEELERRLGRAPWSLRCELRAEGAVVASLVGSLSIADEIELRAQGGFAGGEHDLRLWTEGDHLRAGPLPGGAEGSSSAAALDVPRPPEIAPALVIGMTRMGLLHNVAMLVGGRPPDRADGGVREWVQTIDHVRVEADGETGIAFAIVVGGQRVAEATLWLDARGLPLRREQTVQFPQGQMRVVERYEWVEPPPAGPLAG